MKDTKGRAPMAPKAPSSFKVLLSVSHVDGAIGGKAKGATPKYKTGAKKPGTKKPAAAPKHKALAKKAAAAPKNMALAKKPSAKKSAAPKSAGTKKTGYANSRGMTEVVHQTVVAERIITRWYTKHSLLNA